LKIFFRESDIIYNEKSYPDIRKREVAHMIARQLAFIWCYDVLLWSEEGFATFFGAYILNEVLHIFENNILHFCILQTTNSLITLIDSSKHVADANILCSVKNHILYIECPRCFEMIT